MTLPVRTPVKLGKGCGVLFFSVFAIMGSFFAWMLVNSVFTDLKTRDWTRTECEILEKPLEKPLESDGGDPDSGVRYRYAVGGRSYVGSKINLTSNFNVNGENSDTGRRLRRLPAGSKTVCYVNPASPAEAVLERRSVAYAWFLLLPAVFITVGLGGIYFVWRAKPSGLTAVSERHNRSPQGCSTAVMRVFGATFFVVGTVIMYFMLIQPLRRARSAQNWPEVPCEITASRVDPSGGSKGKKTYRAGILYRYTVGGLEYIGDRYNFDTGSSNNREAQRQVAAQFPPGKKTICFVNPDDPTDAVLSREVGKQWLFGLIPGAFTIVGLGIFLAAPRMAGAGAKSAVPRGRGSGPVALKPASSPLGRFIGITIFALIWNSIVWAIFANTPVEGFTKVFLGLFALIGLGIAGGALYSFLGLFNPQPTLLVETGAVPLGGTLEVQFRFSGNVRRIRQLMVTLQGREEATYRRGTTTTTDKHVFAELPLLETCDHGQMSSGTLRFVIPADSMHSFDAPNNKIIWQLHLHGEVPRWPDVDCEFPISVLPRDLATFVPPPTDP